MDTQPFRGYLATVYTRIRKPVYHQMDVVYYAEAIAECGEGHQMANALTFQPDPGSPKTTCRLLNQIR